MTIEVHGNWKKGLAFDVHTLASTYLGTDDLGYQRWDNTRSQMGELIYRLKYKDDRTTVPHILALLDRIKGIDQMDRIVPIPATRTSRPWQPVDLIADGLGRYHGVPVLFDVLQKSPHGPELKDMDDPTVRLHTLRASLSIANEHKVVGQKILLVDDLYRSGATLTVATELLLKVGAGEVNVLTMTYTRSRR